MSICSKPCGSGYGLALLFALAVLIFIPNTSHAQDLVVSVGDTIAMPGEQNTVITVYMENWEDTVSAFEMWLTLPFPGIMFFKTDTVQVIDTTWWICTNQSGDDCLDSVAGHPDTTYWACIQWDESVCEDSVQVPPDIPYDMMHLPEWDFFHVKDTTAVIGSIDTVGTLIGGWEQVVTRSFTADAIDVKITARANANYIDGVNTPGVPHGEGQGVLFRLLGDVFSIPDTELVRSVPINILASAADNFVFSRPNGTQIGLAYTYYLDTNYYRCNFWADDSCLSWEKVNWPPYDSMRIVPDSQAYIDSAGAVQLEHGSMTILIPDPYVCGNVNNDPDNKLNLADISFLISTVYLGGEDPRPERCVGNVNCDPDGKVNLADISKLIDRVYLSKTPLCSDCCP